MESKLFLFLFFIFIFSLTFSSNEKEDEKQKFQPKKYILNIHDRNLHDDFQNTINLIEQNAYKLQNSRRNPHEDFQNTLNFFQPNADNLQNSNTQNVKIHTNFSDLSKTKEEENAKIPSYLLKTQETEDFNVPVDLLKTHEDAQSSNVSCELLNINPNLFGYIFAYLSLFELELNFKCVSTKIYHLYEKFLQEEKNLLTEEYLNNKEKFLANINCPRVHFDFFEKRLWSEPDRIEYANINYFSKNLVLFPKSIRQIVCFQFNKIEYKYVLFKDGYLSILKKLNKEKNFVLENDFANFEFRFDRNQIGTKIYPSFQHNIRWMEFNLYKYQRFGDENKIYKYQPTYFKINVNLHKANNFTQTMVQYEGRQKIFIGEPFLEDGQKIFLKDISGYLKWTDDGSVTLFRLVKKNNQTHKLMAFNLFQGDVKEIKSKDFEHYAKDFQHFAKEVLFIFNN